jgi:HTH-type transcriptional regulator/antitoxin HigA
MIGTLNYQELLLAFVPRPIVTEAEYEATVAEMNALIDKGDLTPDEQEFLTLLGTLVMVYEDEHLPDKAFELRGIELIKGLMELHNLKQKDLIAIFKTKSIASEVLSGKRPLTVTHINHLAAFFHLPHELFFEPLEQPVF